MNPKKEKKIFERFFTTKGTQGGSPGLPLVSTIVGSIRKRANLLNR